MLGPNVDLHHQSSTEGVCEDEFNDEDSVQSRKRPRYVVSMPEKIDEVLQFCSSSLKYAQSPEGFASNSNLILPEQDVRLTICQEFCTLFNFGDPTEFSGFLRSQCLTNSRHIIRSIFRSPGNHNMFFPEYLELDGIQSILYYWTTCFAAVPDGILKIIKDPKVRIFSDGGSLVSCRFQYQGTQVLNLLTDLSSLIIATNPSDVTGTGILAFQVEGGNRQVREIPPSPSIMLAVRETDPERLTSLPESSIVLVTGTISFYFNNDQRIYKIENIHD